MSLELTEVAKVLEKVAVYIEATEAEKNAAVVAERDRLVTAIREKVSASTGLDISEDVVNKLSTADPEVLATIEKLAESSDSESLGGPSSRKTSNAPLTVDEQVKLAEDNLVNFSVSS
jgi:hypothetical protein